MQVTLARLLADLRTAIISVEQILIDDLPGLVAASLPIAAEEARLTLMRATNATIAAQPQWRTRGRCFGVNGQTSVTA